MKFLKLLCLICATPALADEAPAGLLAGANRADLPPIALSVGEALGAPWVLKSGGFYRVEITSDGSGEMALDMSALSRGIWVDQAVINDIEIKPFGLSLVEFDAAGTVELSFVAVQPGRYDIHVAGGKAALEITIE